MEESVCDVLKLDKIMKIKRNIVLSFLILMIINLNTNAMESCKGTELVLKYKVRLPEKITQKTPVIIMLHGVGSNEDDMFSFANQFPKEYLVVLARAPFELSAGSYAWFHVQFLGDKRIINKEEAEKSRIVLKQFINQIVERYKADASNISLLGFSQGAIMAYSVALTSPEKVKNIGVLGGRLLEEVKPLIKPSAKLKSLNIFLGHGVNDGTMPIKFADTAYEYCQKLGCTIQYKKYPIEHTISQSEIDDFKNWLKN
jgi:phospholipase/carboxylesterase